MARREESGSVEKRTADLEAEVTAIVLRAKGTVIQTAVDHEAAILCLRELKSRQHAVLDHYEPMRLSTHKAYQTVLGERDKFIRPLVQAEIAVKTIVSDYLRREQEARRIREAQAIAEQRKLEEAARKQEVAALKAAGEKEAAKVLKAAPIIIVPVIEQAPKVEGSSVRKTWKFRVVDLAAVPDEWFVLDESRLGKYVRAVGSAAKIPGVEVFEEVSTAIRGL